MLIRCLYCCVLAACAVTAAANVVVVANRTRGEVRAVVRPTDADAYNLRLQSGQVTPLFSDADLHIRFLSSAGQAGFKLDANCAYYFSGEAATPELRKIGLGDQESTHGRHLPGAGPTTPVGVIPVRVLVDEEEPLGETLWQRKLQRRVQQASEIVLRHSGVMFRVIGAGRWDTEDRTQDFEVSLAEFEREVQAPPGGLAIGFTSQYHVVRGRTHLGGTRGPLSHHILLREWSQHVSENERLELLLHELGHYLGAVHSREPDSVMRPVLGDRQSRLAGFDIRFDPVNTLVISMVGEEVRRRNVRQFADLTPATKQRLNQVYKTLAQALPNDPSGPHLAALTQTGAIVSEVDLVKTTLNALASAAETNHALPEHRRLKGDELTAEIVRVTAAHAARLRDRAPKPLLLALGIALDDTAALRSLPELGDLVREADTPQAMAARHKHLAEATLRNRSDLAKHFFLSAALTAGLDARRAEAMGLTKELLDSARTSGFSFADLAADRAGIAFAKALLAGKITPIQVADRFSTEAFMPHLDGLPEGLTAKQFAEQYGGVNDARFLKLVAEIDARIAMLSGYDK